MREFTQCNSFWDTLSSKALSDIATSKWTTRWRSLSKPECSHAHHSSRFAAVASRPIADLMSLSERALVELRGHRVLSNGPSCAGDAG